MIKDFYVAVYNKVGEGEKYHDDLFSLFGTPDGFEEGILGQKSGGDFKSLEWDWGQNGLPKIAKYIYSVVLEKGVEEEKFKEWYEFEKVNNFPEISQAIDKIFYVIKYNRKKIPTFIADLESMSYDKNGDYRIWLKFTPKRYCMLPPKFIDYYRDILFDSWEDSDKWSNYLNLEKSKSDFIFSSAATLDQYHILPQKVLNDWFDENLPSEDKPVFTTRVKNNTKRIEKNLHTNNQIFWGIFYDYIGRTQVKADIEFKFKGDTYNFTDIPVNSIIDKGLVYTHEAGVPKVICEALKTSFQEKYIDKEFPGSKIKKIDESEFITRAVKVKDIAENFNDEYENTDYDYMLDLSFFGIDKKVVFDLTSGLWHKGIGKTKEEYVQQWEHNIFEVPKNNKNIICIWHYGLKNYEEYDSQEIGEFLTDKYQTSTLIKEAGNYNLKGKKTILLPFYNEKNDFFDFNTEFKFLDPDTDESYKTELYKCLLELIKTFA